MGAVACPVGACDQVADALHPRPKRSHREAVVLEAAERRLWIFKKEERSPSHILKCLQVLFWDQAEIQTEFWPLGRARGCG